MTLRAVPVVYVQKSSMLVISTLAKVSSVVRVALASMS